jgi:hypothetical protein
MTSGVKISDKNIILALEKTAGVITAAASRLGMDRASLSRRINESDELKVACLDIKEKTLDLAESKLLYGLQRGDKTYVIFYLKTQGKRRGYVERFENREISEDELDAEIKRELARLAGEGKEETPRKSKKP